MIERHAILSLLILMLSCSSAMPFTVTDAGNFLASKYSYSWSLQPQLGFPWIHRYMPKGFAFHIGESPVQEISAPSELKKSFPEAQFFLSKLASDLDPRDHVPVLLGVMSAHHKGPVTLMTLPNEGQGDFFDLFSGSVFFSEAERREFAEALAHLVSYTFESPCKWLPTEVALDTVQVKCSMGNAEYVVRVFFSYVRMSGDSGHYAGAVIQLRIAAQPALEGDRP
jgi:hypothetical protein